MDIRHISRKSLYILKKKEIKKTLKVLYRYDIILNNLRSEDNESVKTNQPIYPSSSQLRLVLWKKAFHRYRPIGICRYCVCGGGIQIAYIYTHADTMTAWVFS